MRWFQLVCYLRSLPCQCFLFLHDLILEDPARHLRGALDDLLDEPSPSDDPFATVLSSWLTSSACVPCPFRVDCSAFWQWDHLFPTQHLNVSSRSTFGGHSWRLWQRFWNVARQVSFLHDRALCAPSAGVHSPSPLGPVSSSPLPVDEFLSTFNPAFAGLQMLTIEQVDRLRFQNVPRYLSVVVHLHTCRESLVSSALDCCVFPIMMETVLSSIGGFDPFPLIVDLGASCCISPCREDFGLDYATSDVKITDLSSTNTVHGKGLLTWYVLDIDGKEVEIKIPGSHVPSTSIWLLSPQCLLMADSIGGGYGTQDASKYCFHLNNGIILDSPYGHANLPVLSLSKGSDSEIGFWVRCFAFSGYDHIFGLEASLQLVTLISPLLKRSFSYGIIVLIRC